MNARKQRANTMMESTGYASQFESNKFTVKSQTNPNTSYIVTKTDSSLICECMDYLTRKSDCKHIKIVLEIIMKNKCYKNNVFRIMERSQLKLCKYCDSGKIIKKGVRKNTKGTVQIFKCLDCHKRFSSNFGFEKMRYDYHIITGALQMFYAGMSTRDISNHYEMMGIDVSDVAVYKWVCKYSTMVSKYLNDIVPRTNDRVMVRADEVWIKVNGKQNYLFASMDDDSRYWLASDMAETKFQHNADKLLELTKEKIGKSPTHFVTDGLPAYLKSSKKVFGKKTNHIRHIHIAGKR